MVPIEEFSAISSQLYTRAGRAFFLSELRREMDLSAIPKPVLRESLDFFIALAQRDTLRPGTFHRGLVHALDLLDAPQFTTEERFDAYVQIGWLDSAANCAEELGRTELVAPLREKMMYRLYLDGEFTDAAKIADKLGKTNDANNWRKMRKEDMHLDTIRSEGAEILSVRGDYDGAVELSLNAHHYTRAAELLVEQGKPELAVTVSGSLELAKRLGLNRWVQLFEDYHTLHQREQVQLDRRAKEAAARGDTQAAAHYFARAIRVHQWNYTAPDSAYAADIAEEAGRPKLALMLCERQGDFERAKTIAERALPERAVLYANVAHAVECARERFLARPLG